mgnify:CR=1 FL=1
MLTQPPRLTFLRLILAATGLLAWFAAWDAFLLAQKLGITPLTSKTWLALLGGLIVLGALSLLLLAITFTVWRSILNRKPNFAPTPPRKIAVLLGYMVAGLTAMGAALWAVLAFWP